MRFIGSADRGATLWFRALGDTDRLAAPITPAPMRVVNTRVAPRDTYTSGDMRAPGAATGITLFEIAIDEMAYAANIDPLEFRLINYSEVDA